LYFVYNVDQMVCNAAGRVVFRKWKGPDEVARYPRNSPSFTLARAGI
jgi:hypothetical protein